MTNADPNKNKIFEQNKEVFDLAEEARRILFSFLSDFNARKIKLTEIPPHKRIFLFFLARIIKTYSALYTLCREGYGQDACLLLRSLLEILISAKYIMIRPAEADREAVRFVEYKWVILNRCLAESERDFHDPAAADSSSNRTMIAAKFQEYKQKYKITSDRALLTWSGKATKDMAKLADKKLLKEYESAFRIDSRFSHPSIIGDKEYVDPQEDVLVLSFSPSTSGVVLSLKRAVTYLADFLSIFNVLFGLNGDASLNQLQSGITEIFRMEKYRNALVFEKSSPALDKETVDKMSVRFNLSSEN